MQVKYDTGNGNYYYANKVSIYLDASVGKARTSGYYGAVGNMGESATSKKPTPPAAPGDETVITYMNLSILPVTDVCSVEVGSKLVSSRSSIIPPIVTRRQTRGEVKQAIQFCPTALAL